MSDYGKPPPSDPTDPTGREPYGQPTQPAPDPYATQNPYAQSTPGGYGQDPYAQQQNPYGAQPYGQQAHGVPPGVTFAHWGKRVAAYLIDALILVPLLIPYFIGIGIAAGSSEVDPVTGQATISDGSAGVVAITALVSGLLSLAYFIWNYCLKQGKTGYTIGKGILGIKVVKTETGLPIGAGMAFVRQLAHILDSLPCYLGYLWPLWDAHRQTFSDKVVGTYVINQPKS